MSSVLLSLSLSMFSMSKHFQMIEDRVRSVENQLQNIHHIIKEKVKHEVHGQLNSDMKTILEDKLQPPALT